MNPMSIGNKGKTRSLRFIRRSINRTSINRRSINRTPISPAPLLFLSLVLGVYFAVSGCTKEKPETSGELVWLNSFDDALRIASQKQKLIMIDFYADWCGWCKKLDETTYKDSNVIRKAKNLVNVRIDADEHRDLASRYRISGLPTILFVDSAGREVHRVVGYRQAEDFLKEITLAEEKFNKR